MATYQCTNCDGQDNTGWTDFYVYLAMRKPPLCAVCDPNQRCHWHNEATRTAHKDEAIERVSP